MQHQSPGAGGWLPDLPELRIFQMRLAADLLSHVNLTRPCRAGVHRHGESDCRIYRTQKVLGLVHLVRAESSPQRPIDSRESLHDSTTTRSR